MLTWFLFALYPYGIPGISMPRRIELLLRLNIILLLLRRLLLLLWLLLLPRLLLVYLQAPAGNLFGGANH